jgi:uncharacterized protein YceK
MCEKDDLDMKAITSLAVLTLVAFLTGCGTLITLPDRNGEFYLASSADCKAIKTVQHPSPYGCLPTEALFTVPWTLCWAVDIPISLTTDTLLIPYDYIQGWRKGFYLAVVDDAGQPIAGASVKGYSRRRVQGTTDDWGIYRWASSERNVEWIRIAKPGYYETKMEPGGWGQGGLTRELANTNAVKVILRPIVNPHPMYAKKVDTKIPGTNECFGYDLEVGDWVTPAGKGIVSDFIFRVDGACTNRSNYDCNYDYVLSLRFSNPSDGVIPFTFPTKPTYEDIPVGSQLLVPNEAPSGGYERSNTWHRAHTPNSRIDDCRKPVVFRFRVRCETNQAGIVTNAYYGKMRMIEFSGPIKWQQEGRPRVGSPGKWVDSAGDARLKFVYHLNSTPNDRGLEFDPKRNLLKGLTEEEQRVGSP